MAVLTYQRQRMLERKSYASTQTAVVAEVEGRRARLSFMPDGHISTKWYESRTPSLAVGQLVSLARVGHTYVIEAPIAPGGTDRKKYLFNGGTFSPADAGAAHQTAGSFNQLLVTSTIYASCQAATNSWFLVYVNKAFDATGWAAITFRLRSSGYQSTIGVQRTVTLNDAEAWEASSAAAPGTVAEVSVNLAAIDGPCYACVQQAGSGNDNYPGLVEIEAIFLTK